MQLNQPEDNGECFKILHETEKYIIMLCYEIGNLVMTTKI